MVTANLHALYTSVHDIGNLITTSLYFMYFVPAHTYDTYNANYAIVNSKPPQALSPSP